MTAALRQAHASGRYSREFVSLVYLLYAIRDRLALDFITRRLWPRWSTDPVVAAPGDVLNLLDEASDTQPQIRKWSQSSRRKLATSILTALRDFGLLKGTQRKVLSQPPLALATAECIVRLLTAEGLRGREVLEAPTWRLFLLGPEDVAHVLLQLTQARRIRFEKAGSTVVLETPEEWRE
jgi:hypothetical protein